MKNECNLLSKLKAREIQRHCGIYLPRGTRFQIGLELNTGWV